MNTLQKEIEEAENCFRNGDFNSAYQKYYALASEGHGASQVFLGWMIAEGIGVEANPEEAEVWFKRAASLGSTVGTFYYARSLTKRSMHEEAFKQYKIAANQGDLPSTYRLGHSLIYGKGTPIDIESGIKHLESAASSGHIFALREIAILNMKGNYGLLHRIIGVAQFVQVMIFGMYLGMRDRYSERLRA